MVRATVFHIHQSLSDITTGLWGVKEIKHSQNEVALLLCPSRLWLEMICNQRGEFSWLYNAFTGEEQFALRKEVCGGIGLECVCFLDLPAATRHMHLGFTDFN